MTLPDTALLTEHLDQLAASTWHKVHVGPLRGLKFREESITDHNLFELDQRHLGLSVYKFTSTEEALNGADFDWWIGAEDQGWVGMRFQSKKLDDGSYSELGHRVGGERQYDILLRESHADGVWPMYCFYNGWHGAWPEGVDNVVCPNNAPPVVRQSSSSRARGCSHTELDHFGCSVVPAEFVARRHQGPRKGRLELDDYLAASIPWSFLFKALDVGHSMSHGAPEETLQAVSQGLNALFRRQDASRPTSERRERLPSWVEAVRSGERGETRYVPKPRLAVVQDLGVSAGNRLSQ